MTDVPNCQIVGMVTHLQCQPGKMMIQDALRILIVKLSIYMALDLIDAHCFNV